MCWFLKFEEFIVITKRDMNNNKVFDKFKKLCKKR